MKPYYFSLCFIAIFLFSCSEDTDTLSPDPLNPDQETFTSSLFIEVFNTNGQPMPNADIQIGNTEGKTNQDGFLFLDNVVVGKSSYLTAEKDGYFHGSRRFYPTAGQSQYVRIILLSNSRDAFFNASDGGVLPVSGGITLHFPKDGYEMENGDSYGGIVVVSVEGIPADDPELSYKMPGDLIGIEEDEEIRSLASFGMVAVELKSPDGDKINLRAGTEVEMEIEIPASMLQSAPSTMPMWYFDEEVGIWREEGQATLSNGKYLSSLSHFSYWNCDYGFYTAKWGATFNYEDGSPAIHLEVCITIDALYTTRCDYTNAEGLVSGIVPGNELLTLSVKNVCGGTLFSQQVGPYLDTVMIGPVSIPYGSFIKTKVSGKAVNCEGNPVTNGYAKIKAGHSYAYLPTNEISGEFSGTVGNCEKSDVQVSLLDIGNNKLSIPANFNFAANINTGTIKVCEENLEFIELHVQGFQDQYRFDFPDMHDYEGGAIIYVPDSSDVSKAFEIRFESPDAPGTYEAYFGEVYVTLPDGKIATCIPDPLWITITHYGDIGDYVRGTLTGELYTEGNYGSIHPFVGKFAVLRD